MNLLFSIIPQIAWVLSGYRALHAIQLVVALWFFALSRKFFGPSKDFKIQGVHQKRKITFYLRHVMDIAVLREVFIDNEYDWCPIENPKIIVDLGAHFGDTTLYYHVRFPEATIIAAEPSPENYARLVKHTSHIPNIKPSQVAVGGSNGTTELNLGVSSLGHSVMARKDSKNSVTAPLVTLADLLKSKGVEKADLIKFDVEGAEFDIFRSINPADYATAYIGELHFDLGDVSKDEFAKWFDKFAIEWTQIRKDRYLFHATVK